MNNKIGTLKNKILSCLVEAYRKDDKKQMKKIISLLKENKDYRDLYLFYEEIEEKHFNNKNDANSYLEEVIPLLEEKHTNALKFIPRLNKSLNDVEFETNEIYESLDVLLSKKTIHNIDKKIIAKERLINHLTTKKEPVISENRRFVENEPLLFASLINIFNGSFDNQLNEEDKKRLKRVISMSSNEIKQSVDELQESILDKVSSLLIENTDPDLALKLESVKDEVKNITPTRFNLVKLETLKDGLV